MVALPVGGGLVTIRLDGEPLRPWSGRASAVSHSRPRAPVRRGAWSTRDARTEISFSISLHPLRTGETWSSPRYVVI
eukprot:7258459-Prymnesium_polylepis.1